MSENKEVSFEEKRQHLVNLSDDELKNRFWELAEEIVEPLLQLGKEYTSPSIERSILLRMGFSSVEATKIVSEVLARDLMGKGAGHIVYRMAKDNHLEIREAGLKLCNDELWDQVMQTFKGGNE